jgi:hypothetical protein
MHRSALLIPLARSGHHILSYKQFILQLPGFRQSKSDPEKNTSCIANGQLVSQEILQIINYQPIFDLAFNWGYRSKGEK